MSKGDEETVIKTVILDIPGVFVPTFDENMCPTLETAQCARNGALAIMNNIDKFPHNNESASLISMALVVLHYYKQLGVTENVND